MCCYSVEKQKQSGCLCNGVANNYAAWKETPEDDTELRYLKRLSAEIHW